MSLKKHRKCFYVVCQFICAFFICLLFFIGCGKNDVSKEGKTKIVFMRWGTPKEISLYKQWLTGFLNKEKDIYIENIFSAGGEAYTNKLFTMMAGDTAPDLIYYNVNNTFIKMIEKGTVLDLTPYIKRDNYEIKAFYPELVKGCTLNNKIYGIPDLASTFFIYYNKEIFDENKIEYPNDKLDWNKFKEIAKKLTKDTNKDGRTDVYGFSFVAGMVPLIPLIQQMGGELFEIDYKTGKSKVVLNDPKYREKNINALKFFHSFIEEKISPSPSELKEAGRSIDFFEQGKAAMLYGGDWHLNIYATNNKLKWGIARLPKGEKRINILLNFFHFISSKTKHPEETWKLLKYLSSKDMSIEISKKGLPARKNVLESPEYLKGTPLSSLIDVKVIREEMKSAMTGPFLYISAEVEQVLEKGFEQIFLLNEDIPKTLEKMHKDIERLSDHQNGSRRL